MHHQVTKAFVIDADGVCSNQIDIDLPHNLYHSQWNDDRVALSHRRLWKTRRWHVLEHSITAETPGESSGVFGIFQLIELGYAPYGITMGDLNLDGHLDIAFASIGTQNAGMLLGNGDGSFSQSQNYGAGYGAMFIVMDDLDADGDQDLIVLNQFDSYYESKNLSVLLNRLDPPPACRADITRDGVLNFFDISGFLDLLGAHDPIADITDDCRYNFFDISAFLQLYAAGCP